MAEDGSISSIFPDDDPLAGGSIPLGLWEQINGLPAVEPLDLEAIDRDLATGS